MKGLFFGFFEHSHILPKMAAQSHADIRKIVGILSLHRHSDLRTVCSAVHVVFPDHNDEAIRTSIDLAMRLWLTLNTREKSLSLTAGKTPIIRWEHDSSTMVNFVRRQFPSASAFITGAEALLDPYFSAYNLTRNCQVTIEWTCSLADHLSLDLKTRRLRIYPLKICLYDHGNASGTSLSATALTGYYHHHVICLVSHCTENTQANHFEKPHTRNDLVTRVAFSFR